MKNLGAKSREGPHPGRCGETGCGEAHQRVKAVYLDKVSLNLPCAARELPPGVKEELTQQEEET